MGAPLFPELCDETPVPGESFHYFVNEIAIKGVNLPSRADFAARAGGFDWERARL